MRAAVRHVWEFLRAFVRHRWGFRFKTRAALLDFQQRQIRRFLRIARQARFYHSRQAVPLDELPIVDKSTMLAAFADFNTAGISLESARAVALAAESNRDFKATLPRGVTVGTSSGTSGRPNLFLVTAHERSRWAGAILGRMLSPQSFARVINPLVRPLRIAFFLRANSNLYTSLDGWRIRFRFFDLMHPVDAHLAALSEYQPDVLVAPASVLSHIAECQRRRQVAIQPQQVINVAECLEPDDSELIAKTWGLPPQQIYQCTEGVLGFSCSAGSIHLNEECAHFEPQWLDEEHERFSALVTDFSRSTQMFIRFRMDDILHLSREPCACGRVSLRLRSIEGRQDDVLWLPSVHGNGLKPVFPDQIRRAMMLADTQCSDYRIEQDELTLKVAAANAGPRDEDSIKSALTKLFTAFDVQAPAIEQSTWCAQHSINKRRRIRCASKPGLMERSA